MGGIHMRKTETWKRWQGDRDMKEVTMWWMDKTEVMKQFNFWDDKVTQAIKTAINIHNKQGIFRMYYYITSVIHPLDLLVDAIAPWHSHESVCCMQCTMQWHGERTFNPDTRHWAHTVSYSEQLTEWVMSEWWVSDEPGMGEWSSHDNNQFSPTLSSQPPSCLLPIPPPNFLVICNGVLLSQEYIPLSSIRIFIC